MWERVIIDIIIKTNDKKPSYSDQDLSRSYRSKFHQTYLLEVTLNGMNIIPNDKLFLLQLNPPNQKGPKGS